MQGNASMRLPQPRPLHHEEPALPLLADVYRNPLRDQQPLASPEQAVGQSATIDPSNMGAYGIVNWLGV